MPQSIQLNLLIIPLALLFELYLGDWTFHREVKRQLVSNSLFHAHLIEYNIIGIWTDRYIQVVVAAPADSTDVREICTRTIDKNNPIREAEFRVQQGNDRRLYVDNEVYVTKDGGMNWEIEEE